MATLTRAWVLKCFLETMANSLKKKDSKYKMKYEGEPHSEVSELGYVVECPGFYRLVEHVERDSFGNTTKYSIDRYSCDYCGNSSLYIHELSWWERFKRFFS